MDSQFPIMDKNVHNREMSIIGRYRYIYIALHRHPPPQNGVFEFWGGMPVEGGSAKMLGWGYPWRWYLEARARFFPFEWRKRVDVRVRRRNRGVSGGPEARSSPDSFALP